MPNIEDIKKNLASYKAVMKKQGDFTLYASKYIQDVESLLGLVGNTSASEKSAAPVVRKKKTLSPTDESKD